MQGPKSFANWSELELLLTTRALNTERNLVQGSIDFLRENGGTDANTTLQEQIDTVVNLKEEVDSELERRTAAKRKEAQRQLIRELPNQ
jgi:hypothetical protein